MPATSVGSEPKRLTGARCAVWPAHIPARHRALAGAVQRNCDRADALHAQRMTMCIYLLNMREQYRWESGLPISAVPDRAEVGRWIAAREAHWEHLTETGDETLEALPIGRGTEPFAEQHVNDALAGSTLGYAAGVVRFGAPVFVLAEQLSDTLREGIRIRVMGQELARGLNPPVAASNPVSGIVIRRDAMQRWLATRVELAERRRMEDPFSRAWTHYADGGSAHDTLERLIDGEIETLILHELGEMRAEMLLGEPWAHMLAALDDVRAELALRAVRDLLADCLVTLPALHERDAHASLHFWFSTFEGMRRGIAPEVVRAYHAWCDGEARALERVAAQGRERWLTLAKSCLHAWQEGGQSALGAAIAPMLARGTQDDSD